MRNRLDISRTSNGWGSGTHTSPRHAPSGFISHPVRRVSSGGGSSSRSMITGNPPYPRSAQYQRRTGAATRTESDLNAIVAAAQTHNAGAAKKATHQLITDILQAKSASKTIQTKLGIP